MGARAHIALRALSEAEANRLQQVANASSERIDAVKRANALLAVSAGMSFTQAGHHSGLSREGVSQLVERFNQRGLAVLMIAPGRGRKPIYEA
jgi:transposase